MNLPDVDTRFLGLADPTDRAALAASNTSAAKLKMTVALWGANLFAFTLANWLANDAHVIGPAFVRLFTFGYGLLLCYGMHRLLRRLSTWTFKSRAIVLTLVAPLAAETHAWFVYFAFAWHKQARITFAIRDWNEAILALAMWTWFFIAWAGLYLGIEYSAEVKEEERRNAELRDLAQAAKLQALHNQINPHFLFNSLNSLSALILDGRGAEAETLLVRLSVIFRRTLATDPMIDVTLGDEVDLQVAYLEIERTRYPDLDVVIDVPENVRDALVPALLLQPIVENAVKHGVARSSPPARIAISASATATRLRILVENDGQINKCAAPSTGRGIGLANVRERLFERFREGQSFTAAATAADGFRVAIELPLTRGPQAC